MRVSILQVSINFVYVVMAATLIGKQATILGANVRHT